jgi:AraC-like DNA-binding protein
MEKNIYVDDNGFTLIGGRHLINVAFNVHKLSLMLKFAGEQYCTNFSYSKDIKQLEIEGMYSLTYVLKKCNVLLSVIEYGWEVHKAGSSYGPAERDYYILHFITKGKGRFVIGDKEYILKKGDCFLLPPKITTYYEADKKNPYTYYWIGFDGIEAKGLLEKTGLVIGDNYVIHPKNFNSVFEMFSNFDVSTTNNSAIPYQLVGKLYLLFSEIMSDQSSENEQKSNYVDLAINYMNLNYAKNISIELLSRIVGVDRTYFYRLFKESTKISPKEYLSNLRIEKAKMLLCNSNMNIKEIALSVGFSNYLSFERVFKEKSGVNPTIYRKKNT